jgi:eukaryotic-like serine/threonine-protein kinase
MNHLEADAKAIFLEALDCKGADELMRFLERACGADAPLRTRVEELMQAHRDAGAFLGGAEKQAATCDQPSAERPGTVIGPYKLLQQIGEGGMGTVFMAEQTQPVQRKVALKVIKPGLDSRQVIARFEAERQALALMDHVNIARVFDAGATEAGRPYFVMELVHGVPITKYCDDNLLTPRERLELFVPVCQAIQHAHQKGIIHRDVKPSNVMITLYDGKPVAKVIDFGVAKATEQKLTERTLFTQYGTLVGTLEYMSPEQAEMSALGVDTRSDVYSLGVLLYELLTGSTPLSHKRVKEAVYAEVLRMIKEEEPPRPSTRLSDSGETLVSISAQRKTEPAKLSRLLRGELDWIVMKTLEKDRNRRYETAKDFAADVQRYLNDEAVQACPPSVGYRFRKFARRNKRILATVGLLALALITGTVVSAWQAIRATEAQNATREQLHLTEQAQEQATRRLYDARLAQARAGSLSRRVGQRLDSLDALAEAAKIARDLNLPEERLLERRNAAIAFLALPDLRLARQWPGWPAGSDHVDFDGKLEHYARVDKQGAVSVRRVADDKEIASLPGSGSETFPLFSRDGKFLSVWSAGGLNLWKLGGHDPVRIERLPADDAYGIDFSPDSRQCAIGHANGSISLYDLPSGQPPRQLPGSQGIVWLAFDPEGRRLAVACGNAVEIRDLDTGKAVALPHPVQPWHLAWHPDGKTLAVACYDARIYLWDVAAGKQTLVIEGLRNGGIKIAFNHAGDLLASAGWDGMLRLWDPRTGKQLFGTMSPLPNATPRFSPDDCFLAGDCRDGQLGLWEVAAGREYRTLVRAAAAGKGIYRTTAIRADGRLLAVGTGMPDGVGMWDLTSGRELAFLKLPGINWPLFVEPSGALLTNGSAGLLRWPIQAEPASPALLRLGPPQKLSVPGSGAQVACSLDGQVIASAQFQSGLVLHAERPDQPVPLGPHDDVRYIAVSPDGRLVATGSQTRTGVKIWDAQSGKPVKELPADGSYVGFSPNGKWLIANGRLWANDSWQPGPLLGSMNGASMNGAFAFSRDSKLLALETGYGAVRLVNPDTGREYARLEDPNQDRAYFLSFSPDGTQLVATNDDSQSIHVWDLRAIREQLVKMGLDWDLPSYPPAPEITKPGPLRIQVELGDPTQLLRDQEETTRQAIERYRRALVANPNNAKACNALAWAYLTAPEALRDVKAALPLAENAVRLAPGNALYGNTLGVAYYRAGRYREAVEVLRPNLNIQEDWALAFDLYFLAMSHHRLGETAQGQDYYAWAVRWTRTQPGLSAAHLEELKVFRAEAEMQLRQKSGVKSQESEKKQEPD